MVEEEVSLAVEHLLDGGGDDLVVVAAVPPVPVLPDVGGVVAGLDVADVVDHSEQRVAVVPVRGVVSDSWGEKKFKIQNGWSATLENNFVTFILRVLQRKLYLSQE